MSVILNNYLPVCIYRVEQTIATSLRTVSSTDKEMEK